MPTRRSALVVHLLRPSKWRNHQGIRICECGSLETDSVHNVPAADEGWKALEARRVGEREEDD